MKIAILGGGFAGVATAWHLLQFNAISVALFDAAGIAQGSSGLSTALLHPFAGPSSKLNFLGLEGFSATGELLKIASEELLKPVFEDREILRCALTKSQGEKFALAAKENPHFIKWIDAKDMREINPYCPKAPGIVINKALAVYAKSYLQGLWQACEKRGARLHPQSIIDLHSLSDFDAVVIAVGGAFKEIKNLPPLPLSLIKGQQLQLKWPKDLPPLKLTIGSQLLCTMNEDKTSCVIGSTFEREFASCHADMARAKQELLPSLKELLPPLYEAKILSCHAGIRVSAPERKPYIKNIDHRTWIFTGLASKGLLYHALYSKNLARQIVDALK